MFPTDLIKKWKSEHESKIINLFVAPKFKTRSQVRAFLKPLFAENHAIFNIYGPYSKNAQNKQASTELMWDKLAIEKILPNNRLIEQTISQHEHLLQNDEYGQYIEFKLHREGFEYNKLSGDVNDAVPTFPSKFELIFDEKK